MRSMLGFIDRIKVCRSKYFIRSIYPSIDQCHKAIADLLFYLLLISLLLFFLLHILSKISPPINFKN